MKAILMAGGFAKRLNLLNKSKCLIEIGGKPIIDYTLEKLKEIPEISEVIVITNDTFYGDFVEWAKKHTINIRILSDGGNSQNSKIGALTALLNFIENENFDEDFFLAGADNFFRFSLKNIFETFKRQNKDVAVFYDIKDLEKAKRFGVALIDTNNLIINFEEKPENPKSTIVSSCMYFFRKETIPLIKELNNK